jgi:hypothetical protein
MQISPNSPPEHSDPVDAARVAIWRLFQEGYVDEDMATAGLLAVDLGTRRAQRKTKKQTGELHHVRPLHVAPGRRSPKDDA